MIGGNSESTCVENCDGLVAVTLFFCPKLDPTSIDFDRFAVVEWNSSKKFRLCGSSVELSAADSTHLEASLIEQSVFMATMMLSWPFELVASSHLS